MSELAEKIGTDHSTVLRLLQSMGKFRNAEKQIPREMSILRTATNHHLFDFVPDIIKNWDGGRILSLEM